jgi:hypothetical protein
MWKENLIMRRQSSVCLSGLVGVSLLAVEGCSPSALRREVDLNLNNNLASFNVESGVAARNTGSYSFDNGGITIGSGSIALDPAALTFTPAETSGGKVRVAQQAAESTMTVMVWIDGPDAIETVCETGEDYGPFTVTLVDNVPVGISPNTVELSRSTINLLNSGSFTLCIEVVSQLTGTVTINKLVLNLGL